MSFCYLQRAFRKGNQLVVDEGDKKSEKDDFAGLCFDDWRNDSFIPWDWKRGGAVLLGKNDGSVLDMSNLRFAWRISRRYLVESRMYDLRAQEIMLHCITISQYINTNIFMYYIYYIHTYTQNNILKGKHLSVIKISGKITEQTKVLFPLCKSVHFVNQLFCIIRSSFPC